MFGPQLFLADGEYFHSQQTTHKHANERKSQAPGIYTYIKWLAADALWHGRPPEQVTPLDEGVELAQRLLLQSLTHCPGIHT